MNYPHCAYENKFQIGDKLCLMNYDHVKKVNSKFSQTYNWIMTEIDFDHFNGKPLYVKNMYYFHNGLPIYELSLNPQKYILDQKIDFFPLIKLYEGYLRKSSKELTNHHYRILSKFRKKYSSIISDYQKDKITFKTLVKFIESDLRLIKTNKSIIFKYFKFNVLARIFEIMRKFDLDERDLKLMNKSVHKKRMILHQTEVLNSDEQKQMLKLELTLHRMK